MATATNVLVLLIALEHLWFLVLEMFLWMKPYGLKTFSMTREEAASSAPLAANQGLYNGFLAAGLLWSLLVTDPAQALALKVFFLGCVTAAGVFGGFTVSMRILLVQAVPAAVALALVWLGSRAA